MLHFEILYTYFSFPDHEKVYFNHAGNHRVSIISNFSSVSTTENFIPELRTKSKNDEAHHRVQGRKRALPSSKLESRTLRR